MQNSIPSLNIILSGQTVARSMRKKQTDGRTTGCRCNILLRA